ncbi:electron transport complex subunit RsxC [Pantoea sp. PNA 03-3]|uniref:electron transport complex subunit RsxC n=1 Tax=Pantoea sp. PNA 03-3 TaxID=2135460 RepID=UPI000D772799|nr:electron transport complex subunit RsxC [Pantoea sp. PNA 03-3]PXV78314.1 electron transport complex protein RnfC [Pantoea sp. PNA 03-3]
MLNLLNFFKKEKIWDFQGGIHPPEMKTQSNGTPLAELPLPHRFIIPLKQHIGHEGEICVSPGDKVLRGQPLTFGQGRMLPVHAPTSGVIDAIAQHMTAHPSGLSELCIFLTPDGDDRWMPLSPLPDYRQHERSAILKRIHDAGIAGLGGAGFPTATKLKGGLQGVNTLIINAAECEPYITADDRLMQDCAAEVLEGCRILAWVLQAERVLIGIEDNKPEAIAALKQALGGERDLQIRVIPTKYPSGGAKQLTKILTGMEVPHGGRSTDIGVVMQNVGTAWAVKRAIINGEPITERVVTLTGEAIAQPRNVWSRLGTPISHLLHQVGFHPSPGQMVIMGGPLMGFTLPSLDVPVVKITNCILAPSGTEMGNTQQEQSCIRCSACADACPANLLPQQLYWYSQGGDHDKARAHHIDDCIECGACAYVCPSNIPLVQYYRQEKAELRAIDLEAKRTLEAKARFEARQARLEREKQAREARHAEAKQRVARSESGELAAAKARARAKQSAENEDAAAEARHAQARLRQAEAQAETQALSRQTTDPRKAAVEAAIARARAKKPVTPDSTDTTETAVADPRKAAVTAAIERAKAKKAAQASADAEAADTASEDPRKAAVTAAVERAKAKKAAQAADAKTADTASEDPRKAAVAAAVERAKAKKAAQTAADAEAADTASDDPRKAAVAAAVERAKAKKAAQTVADAEAADTASDDPRKAAVAAAVERAKAKKAAQAADAETANTASDDPRKAAVAAAIERAKAKKAARAAADAEAADTASDDPRKAAVAAAVERAKAKKAAQAADGETADTAPEDPRKAAVAAAVERAKAKKRAAAQAQAEDASREAAVAAAEAHRDVEQAERAQEQANHANAEAEEAPELDHPADARKAAIAAAVARAKARKAQSTLTPED